ncbi:MAG: MFS transporter [Pseudomonadales bacterium]|jgi:MFS family permease|nr:MFS transporter [Pseudomonadales bacterium]MDP7357609.1 MFS transporter [Pseudomonadales bacterium]MDP7595032.1 MFS transporter [Pseudomonadales bacterium]HJN51411.1 MFS transporter [Pseudomonadales bacterium]|tara:strand:- start:72 stop:1718 length:1647 start_codon:yes stop_codon:yes gene_type:complete
MANDNPEEKHDSDDLNIGGGYAKYVLAVLVLVYVFNFIDRQILSILAEDIKADLGITDAQIGFLYGTAFAVFYAVFGIPLGRLADVWVRKNLISIGLMFWSAMTALSGTARGFTSLAVYRIGVGVGEASATPAAFSMLSDYFPPKLRTTALGIYSSGVYIGAGIGIFLGGVILDAWNGAFPDPATSPFGLKGWHVAFFTVGLPGLVMAIWVWTLKEPKRGQSEGMVSVANPHPFRETWLELQAILPFFNLASLYRLQAGSKGLLLNVAIAIGCALVFYGLYLWLGNAAQWTALGIGVYCAFSWAQGLARRDPATFAMIFKCRTLIYFLIGMPCFAFIGYGAGFWAAPFFLRVHGVSAAETGTVLGLSAALGGWLGVSLGAIAADKLRQYTVRGKLYVAISAVILSLPMVIMLLLTDDLITAYIFNFLFALLSPMWLGPGAATINDLVLPRMRAIASAFYLMMITFIGLALGPFMMGQISDAFIATGSDSGEGLRLGMLWGLSMAVPSVMLIFMAILNIEKDEASRLERARAAGEVIDPASVAQANALS